MLKEILKRRQENEEGKLIVTSTNLYVKIN